MENKLTSLWGESLNFSFSGEACLTKYKLLNHMCNKLLQKLPRLQFPAKREEPAFTDTGLQAQAFVGIPCPLLHFPSHFYCFILDLDRQYHWNGLGTVYLRAVFYLHDHHVSTAFANVNATGMPWKGLISMHAVAAEHKYV